MARRSSAASRSSSRSAARGKSPAGPRVRSDGKVDIYCPQCGAHYRVAEDALDGKVTCRDCTRVFIAKTTVGKRARPKDYTKVYVGIGIGAVIVVGSLVALSQLGGYKPMDRRVVEVTGPSAAELEARARTDAAVKWAQRVASGDLFAIRSSTDMQAVGTALGVPANSDEAAHDAAILAALKTNEHSRVLFETDCTSGLVTEENATGPTGKGLLYLIPRPGDTLYDPKSRGEMEITFRMEGTQMKVTGFALTMKPVQRGRRDGEGGKAFKPSTDIARPEDKEIMLGGQKIKVQESPPVALPHEPGTPPEVQQKIDALVADLLRSADPDSPGNLFNRTCAQLKAIGKPAVPRLLNAMHDLYPDVMANNQRISQIDRCLLDMTGMQCAYNVAGTGDAAKDKASRESSIRQWFAWWWRYANDTHTDAIDKEEDLFGPSDKDKQKPKGN